MIFGFVSIGLGTGFIPIFSEIIEKKGKDEANHFTNNVINLIFIISTAIVILGLLFMQDTVKIFASGFDKPTLELASKYTRISLFSIYFAGLITIFKSFLRVKNKYIVTVLIGIPLNFIILLSILFSAKSSNNILAIGYLIAVVSQLIFLIPEIKKSGYTYKLNISFKNKDIIKLGYIAFPTILGVSVNEINKVVANVKHFFHGFGKQNFHTLISTFCMTLVKRVFMC